MRMREIRKRTRRRVSRDYPFTPINAEARSYGDLGRGEVEKRRYSERKGTTDNDRCEANLEIDGKRTYSQIVCKFFIQAIEDKKYGWL